MVNMKGLYGFFDFLKNLRKLFLFLFVLLFCFSSYAGSIMEVTARPSATTMDTGGQDTTVFYPNETSFVYGITISCNNATARIVYIYDTNVRWDSMAGAPTVSPELRARIVVPVYGSSEIPMPYPTKWNYGISVVDSIGTNGAIHTWIRRRASQ